MDRRQLGVLLAAAVLIGVLPAAMRDAYLLTVMIVVGIHVLVAQGLIMLIGFTGQLSLCQGAFYGIGAYVTAVLSTKFGLSPWVAMVLAVLTAAAAAYLLGLPALKLKGHYLAMATLGFGEIVNIVFKEWGSLTGGPSGLIGIPRLAVGSFVFDSDLRYYFLVWGVVLLVIVFLQNLTASRTGRALLAISRSEAAAAAMGVPVARYKINVFVLCAALAALAGTFYAHYVTVISPETFDVFFSVMVVTMVVAGGMRHVWGGVLGAALFTVLPEFLHVVEDYHIIVYGGVLLFILMVMPQGIVGLIGDVAAWLRRASKAAPQGRAL